MTLLAHITDTHILPPGEVLYGEIDTAQHLADTVQEINRMKPVPDVVMVTGDLVENGQDDAYLHFIDLIKPLEMPVLVIPGNHDDPAIMADIFSGTPYFPASDETFQYAVEDFPFRILALNSHCEGTELPELGDSRLNWLQQQLEASDKPTLIALHHPPMTTGIELIDMGGSEWFQGLESLLAKHPQVGLVICGHCHADLYGHIAHAPVFMASANSHQLVATRGLKIAPASLNQPAAVTLHHFIDGKFLSGSQQWPANVQELRIDKKSGFSWETLKKSMMGNRSG